MWKRGPLGDQPSAADLGSLRAKYMWTSSPTLSSTLISSPPPYMILYGKQREGGKFDPAPGRARRGALMHEGAHGTARTLSTGVERAQLRLVPANGTWLVQASRPFLPRWGSSRALPCGNYHCNFECCVRKCGSSRTKAKPKGSVCNEAVARAINDV